MADIMEIGYDGQAYQIGGSSSQFDGIPILTEIPTQFSTLYPGFLSTCMDNGILDQAVFPNAYAELVRRQAAGDTGITDLGTYATLMTAQSGVCGLFGLDTVGAKFRIPCIPSAIRRAGTTVGTFVPMEVNNSGSEIRFIDTNYQMKMYGNVVSDSQANIAELIAATTGKLDASVYNNQIGQRLTAKCRFNSVGLLTYSPNVVGFSREGAGLYAIDLMDGTTGQYPGFVLALDDDIRGWMGFTSFVQPVGYDRIGVRFYNTSNVQADIPATRVVWLAVYINGPGDIIL